VVRYTVTGEIPTRIGSAHASLAPYDVFETQDGWVVIGIGNDSLWERFCKVIQKEELISDPLYKTNDLRSQNYNKLKPIVTAWTKEQSSKEIEELLTRARVPAAEVKTMDKIVKDPNIKLRNMLIQMDHPKAGKVTVTNSPIRLSESSYEKIDPAPLLGEHTEEVLGEILGLSEEAIEELREKKVI